MSQALGVLFLVQYRRLLIRALHLTTIRVGDATFASQVVSVLLDILTEQTDVKATGNSSTLGYSKITVRANWVCKCETCAFPIPSLMIAMIFP